MRENHLWNRAKLVRISTGAEIVGGFDVGFDDEISEEIKNELMRFVYWVEDHFYLPVTLWVDFKYNHYLRNSKHEPVGYRFYWAKFQKYPVFDNPDDIPVIELPVRMERWTREEILTSFIEAISLYFIWLMQEPVLQHEPDELEVEEVLQAYLCECAK